VIHVLTISLVAMLAMSMFCTWYVYSQGGTLDDEAAGWSTDLMLGLAGLTMALNSRIVSWSPFTYFYIGTAIAYGLGGIGHYLEDLTSVVGRIAYYTIFTAAYGGDWLRSTYGYGMPQSWVRTAQRCFAGLTMLAITICAIATLVLTFKGDTKEEIDTSFWGKAYVNVRIMFAYVEASGSLVWYAGTWEHTGKWGIIATSFNVTSWVVVKYLPLYFARWKFESEITYLVYHLMQYVVLWALYTLHTLRETRTEDKGENKDGREISKPHDNSSDWA
jgi:hypothetical protein